MTPAGIIKLAARHSASELSAAAVSMLPSADFDFATQGKAENVISEVKSYLGIQEDDQSERSRIRILNALTDAITSSRSSADLLEARARVGQRGLVDPRQYRVLMPKSARSNPFFQLTPRRLIFATVNNPDQVEHLFTHSDAGDFSLFAKTYPRTNRIPAAILVVGSFRKALTQTPQTAWWIFPDEVDVSRCVSVTDLLEAFAEKYGFDLEIGDYRGRFLRDISVERFHVPLPDYPYLSQFIYKPNVEGTVEVMHAFVIPTTMYKASVRRHGRGTA